MGIGSAETIVEIATTVFVLSTMFYIGIELSLGQLLVTLRKRQLMAKSLSANLVVVPVLAYLLVYLVPLDAGYAAGLMLIAVAPGAPFGPKFAEISKSGIEFASGLMAILGILSVVTIPVSLALFLPGTVTVDPFAIGWLILSFQLLPLLAGIWLEYQYSFVANSLYPPFSVFPISRFSF